MPIQIRAKATKRKRVRDKGAVGTIGVRPGIWNFWGSEVEVQCTSAHVHRCRKIGAAVQFYSSSIVQ